MGKPLCVRIPKDDEDGQWGHKEGQVIEQPCAGNKEHDAEDGKYPHGVSADLLLQGDTIRGAWVMSIVRGVNQPVKGHGSAPGCYQRGKDKQ